MQGLHAAATIDGTGKASNNMTQTTTFKNTILEQLFKRSIEPQERACHNLLCIMNNHKGTEVEAFIDRVLEWRMSNAKASLLEYLFSGVFSTEDYTEFLVRFHTFVSICLSGENKYVITWNELTTVGWREVDSSRKLEPHIMPKIHWRSGWDKKGLSNVTPLMEAMDIMETRNEQCKTRCSHEK